MYKIKEFSIISRTTIKTLRYYEKEGLLIPKSINKNNGYRYYGTEQLSILNKILSLRQIGLSIKDIKVYLNNKSNDILYKRKKDIIDTINLYNLQLSKINYMLEDKEMNEEIVLKKLPKCSVYYMEGVIKDYSELTNFILSTGEECLKINPNIKCVSPDYCYINYLDKEYKEKDIHVRYAQAVIEKGIENDKIKFMDLDEVEAVSILHKGDYARLGESYSKIFSYIEKNNYEVIDFPRECYIDGMWNKDNVEDYLTEIQIPVKRR